MARVKPKRGVPKGALVPGLPPQARDQLEDLCKESKCVEDLLEIAGWLQLLLIHERDEVAPSAKREALKRLPKAFRKDGLQALEGVAEDIRIAFLLEARRADVHKHQWFSSASADRKLMAKIVNAAAERPEFESPAARPDQREQQFAKELVRQVLPILDAYGVDTAATDNPTKKSDDGRAASQGLRLIKGVGDLIGLHFDLYTWRRRLAEEKRGQRSP